MMVNLPIVREGPYFGFSCELDSVTYQFTFRWNGRDGSWFMDLADGEGTVLVAGVKVVLGVFLGLKHWNQSFPPGMFLAIDTSGADEEAGFDDLGKRVVVSYTSFAELAS